MNKPVIFGILNVTPDSFSDGGRFFDASAAVEQAFTMINDGADVIDIGGMSTRPGFSDVSEDEEIRRVVPVIKRLKAELKECVISVDTFRAGTASAAIEAGADIINDITGLMGDEHMASVIADAGVKAVLMRDGMADEYEPWETSLMRTVDAAKAAGIPRDRIMLDPGVGFTKTREQDQELIRAIPRIKDRWGCPVLLGVSRKRVTALYYKGEVPADGRDGASVALALRGIELGASAVRVHNVRQTYAAIRAYESIKG
ncbi:MAG: dihydropteroate synthase [Clostridiales bacterium]|nr:dihydropteroate synthase [Clostridiales bacterium]